MSFSKDIKKEILEYGLSGDKMYKAFLAGLIFSSGEFKITEKGVQDFFISTEVDFLYDYLKQIVQSLYKSSDIEKSEYFKISTTQYFKLSFNDDLANKILLDVKVVKPDLKFDSEINQEIIADIDGLKGFISGAFIGCGTSSIKVNDMDRITTGYHLEMNNKSYELLHEIADLLAQFDIFAKLTKRKNTYILYIKDAEQVSNCLALLGASDAVLKLQNEIVTRQVRNKINRQNNCYTFNLNKTLNASFNQLEAIKIIDENMGIYNLPEDLLQAALLRLANTEESLDELLKLSKTPLTKSALNHKFQKLIKISKLFKKE